MPLQPGQMINPHWHPNATETATAELGQCTVFVLNTAFVEPGAEDEELVFTPHRLFPGGTPLEIAPGIVHFIRNESGAIAEFVSEFDLPRHDVKVVFLSQAQDAFDKEN